jgi:hypothetical protein
MIETEVVKEGDPSFKHEWNRVEEVLDCLPPIRIRTCWKCGRVEARTDSAEAVSCER